MRKSYIKRNRNNKKADRDLECARVRMLRQLAEIRHSFSADETIQYLRILYHMLLIDHDKLEAVQAASQICEEFGMTVPQGEKGVLFSQSKKRFTNKMIIKLLNLTSEEQEAIGINKNIKKEEQREKNEISRIDRDINIVALFLKGYGYEKISHMLPPELSASKSTVMRTVKKLTNYDRTVKLDQIDFYHERCYHAGKPNVGPDEEDLGWRRLALYHMRNGDNVYLDGKAGVGKSWLIEEFVRSYPEPEKILKVAMTGVAAQHIKGHTIHSKEAFNLECRVYRKNEPVTEQELKTLHGIKVVIIDEISTVRVDIFHRMMQIIRRAEEVYGTAIQVVLAGEFRQLPPVATKEDMDILREDWNLAFYQRPYCFVDEEMWESFDFKPMFLTTVKRQDDPEFVEALHNMLHGYVKCVSYFNHRVDLNCGNDYEAIHLCARNDAIDAINARAIALHANDTSFQSFELVPIEETELPENASDFREEFRVFPVVEVYIGLRIMTVINKGNYYQNGTIGIVTGISESCIFMRCMEDGRTIKIRRERIPSKRDKQTYFEQFPIVPAIAISIHKAQGCTFDRVVLHPEKCDSPYQLYVACSRVKTIEGLKLTRNINPNDVKTDSYVEGFYRKIGRPE